MALQWGHLLSTVETRTGLDSAPYRLTGFNGATSFRRWKPVRETGKSTARLSFNGATSFRRWKLRLSRWTLSDHGRFNGATSFRRWKLLSDLPAHRVASMGPPPFGGGNPRDSGTWLASKRSLQWGHLLSAVETRVGAQWRYAGIMLQWGHLLSAVETRRIKRQILAV